MERQQKHDAEAKAEATTESLCFPCSAMVVVACFSAWLDFPLCTEVFCVLRRAILLVSRCPCCVLIVLCYVCCVLRCVLCVVCCVFFLHVITLE